MTDSNRSVLRAFLKGLSRVLFAIAGLAFLFGGRAISEFGKIDRLLAELLGLAIAFGLGMLGYVIDTTADDLAADNIVNE